MPQIGNFEPKPFDRVAHRGASGVCVVTGPAEVGLPPMVLAALPSADLARAFSEASEVARRDGHPDRYTIRVIPCVSLAYARQVARKVVNVEPLVEGLSEPLARIVKDRHKQVREKFADAEHRRLAAEVQGAQRQAERDRVRAEQEAEQAATAQDREAARALQELAASVTHRAARAERAREAARALAHLEVERSALLATIAEAGSDGA